ncbi:hypothetical protein BJF85_05595 [Saccharomonospora sp. CUA-673]|uniref:hypothetical protein n=1 Tax=Saccharomonospora sp. CUA-673 TaxID=1904969 RepID=UPI00095C01D0|nr:hypothetical protein [Saccharomonospora sp. CUA-673]OLT40621.1 hypothetical protein BJF85_05595 [Saccharomonospora sp. CUA-673]
MVRWGSRAALLVTGVLVLSACGAGPVGDPPRTLTIEQARERSQEHVDNAVAALPVQPRLTLTRFGDSESECTDPTDHGPRGRYQVGKSYWLDDLPADRNAEFVDVLFEHWQSSDYRVLTDNREEDNRFVSVEHNDDAFRMSVTESTEGDLSIGASSPCVWPDGEPPADAE